MPKELKYKIIYDQMHEKHFIDGKKINPINIDKVYNIINPKTETNIKSVALEDVSIIDICLKSSIKAFNSWSIIPMHKKNQLLIKWYVWIESKKEDFIKLITEENGKPYDDAKGEFQRGLEVLQYAISLQPSSLGESGQINSTLSINSFKEPIGIVLAICPFNFPFMIPMWFIPIAIILGNVIIIKPSEKVPGCTSLLAEGAEKCGIPDGVINVIQGGKIIVEQLIENENIKAVSFVGSTFIGKKIYDLACKNRKKVQCNMGAKNHVVVTQSSNYELAVNGIISAAFGGCGQRCMALSVCITVGNNDKFIQKLIEKTKTVNVEKEMGPLITKTSLENINKVVNFSTESEILLDRRKDVPDKGFYLGPVIIKSNQKSEVYKKELFGPVLVILEVKNLSDAIQIINANAYGNGTCIYTDSSFESLLFQKNVEVGQIGINVPIPVPPPYFSWSSSKESFIGSNYIYGPQSIDFYTKTKTVMTKIISKEEINLNMPHN
jgi:malonate-semialdehyde dehydrogenase (acetylating) / methylmalonate-semialdehyde dehydrogenase